MSNFTLDEEGPGSPDPSAGSVIGPSEVICHLTKRNPTTLLAFRFDPIEGGALAVLRRLSPELAKSPQLAAEARIGSGLRHAHLVRVYGVDANAEASYWVQEFVPGATLAEVAEACKRKGIALPMGFALPAIHQAALGIQHLHASPHPLKAGSSAVHGFIRPQNIVISFAGPAKLLNPGYLRCEPVKALEAEPFAGNAGYLSPEFVRGEPLDPRSDVFSLAVLVHEALSGRPLFTGRGARERMEATLSSDIPLVSRLNLSVGEDVDQVLLKALSREREARYANATAFSTALKEVAGKFMWREAQRLEFIARLFPTRATRAKALEATLKEKETHKRAEAERAAEEARRAEAARQAQIEREAAARAEEMRRRAQSVQQKPPTLTTGSNPAVQATRKVPWLAVAGGALVLVGVLGAIIGLRKKEEPPPAPPPPVVVAAPPPPVVDQTDAGEQPDAGVDADAGVVSDEDAGSSPGPRKRRKKKDAAPLPPWLQ